MSVGCHLPVNWAPQLQITDDRARAQVEMLKNQLRNLLVRDTPGAKGFTIDAQRVRDTNRISHLDFTAFSQPGGYHVLGSPTGGISS